MFKRHFAVTLTAVLLSAAGAAQAATSTFPAAAEEGSGVSINTPLPVATIGLGAAGTVFPSAALEGGESNERIAGYSTPRSLERSYAGGHGGVLPNSAMD